MFGLEISSVPVILPTLERLMHGDLKDLQWIMNAYTIACTTVLMAAGTLADRYGRKRLFIITLTGFGLTSLICGLATSMPVLIVSRFMQGMSGGAMMICLFAILSHQFREERERSRAFGAFGIIFGAGLGFGPLIGGAIVALSSWEWVFLVHVPLTLLTLFLAITGVTESRDPEEKKLDIAGIVTLSLAVFGLTYFITQGSDMGFVSPAGMAIIGATVFCFAVFMYVEKTVRHPMFDFSVFRIRDFSGAMLGSIGMNFSFWPLMIYLPLYFQSVLGYGAVDAGLALLAYTLPTLVVPPFAERLSLRYRPGVVIPVGMFTLGLGFILMWCGSGVEHANWLGLLPGCVIAGVGVGMSNTPVTNTATGSVSANRAGMASGIDMSARLITLAVNIALMGFLLLECVLAYLREHAPANIAPAQLRGIGEAIAAGNLRPAFLTGLDANLAQAALAHGLGALMLYGGVGVWILAALSYLIFNSGKTSRDRRGAATVFLPPASE
ncbi:EmrB/QacA subfamily drug resistance transporter [Massilia violacea]|uniref:EmrB/QacA subfamily drug resistance transporter n=2 Tax=Pseudoduganella violacea TaxID=1715466 RepID=A0A7W5B678_9BURK|nr:EmrB/QacA subfamily drug resistance transporter [Pseudoduganella violacea]